MPDQIICGHLSSQIQADLTRTVLDVLQDAPLFQPTMPRWGTPLSVRMSNCGPLGWVADKSGYRYQAHHPVTGKPWPPMPRILLDVWEKFADYLAPPEACLINFYGPKAKMGLHQDKDEDDLDAPVLSVSLGDSARFRIGGLKRTDPSQTFDLVSGDVMVLSGDQRLAFHGIDRTYPGTSDLLAPLADQLELPGRLNLTLRRVTKPQA